jgi:prepilin-type N-terminal cleavage/methylation domain-containing protein
MLNKKGYSLLELTVVVLIIAILAAIAIPNYRVTVEKTRIMTKVSLLKSLQEAIIQFYPQENAYPATLKKLHVTLPEGNGGWTYNGLSATDKDGICTITLEPATDSIDLSCSNSGSADWTLSFSFFENVSGNIPGIRQREFVITSPYSGRRSILTKVAESSGWTKTDIGRYNL